MSNDKETFDKYDMMMEIQALRKEIEALKTERDDYRRAVLVAHSGAYGRMYGGFIPEIEEVIAKYPQSKP